jgi:hypothetical protein
MLHLQPKEHLSRNRYMAVLSALLLITTMYALPAAAQAGGAPRQLDLGIIVLSTQARAEAVLEN